MSGRSITRQLVRAARIALWLGTPIDVQELVRERTGACSRTVRRWSSLVRRTARDQELVKAHLWLAAIRLAQKEEDDSVARFRHPPIDEEARKQGLKGRQFTREELAAAAAEIGLGVYRKGSKGRRKRKESMETTAHFILPGGD